MALTREEKQQVVSDIGALLAESKMTVVATYQGTPVKAMQELRKQAAGNGTRVQVVKNRLVIKALEQTEGMKDLDTSALSGMLVYAFNAEDEVAPAHALATFAKTQPTIEFVGAISADGTFLSAEEVKALATLPGKEQLIAEVIAQLMSPVNDITNGLSGNLHALLDGIREKAAEKPTAAQ